MAEYIVLFFFILLGLSSSLFLSKYFHYKKVVKEYGMRDAARIRIEKRRDLFFKISLINLYLWLVSLTFLSLV